MKLSEKDFAYTMTKSGISMQHNKKLHMITKDHPHYDDLVSAICQKNWDRIPEMLVPPKQVLTTLTDGQFKVVGNEIWIGTDKGDKRLPEDLESVVLDFLGHKLPFEPLLKFGRKLFNNPDQGSIEQFYTYIDKHAFPLTKDGNFIAYKRVNSDFKDFHSGLYDNSPGKVVEMPRSEVKNDPSTHCAAGLHAANWGYASEFYNSKQGVVVAVEIDPADVVSVPSDKFEKLRVCKYKVLEVMNEEVRTPCAPADLGKPQEEKDAELGKVKILLEKEYSDLSKEKFFYCNLSEGDCIDYVVWMIDLDDSDTDLDERYSYYGSMDELSVHSFTPSELLKGLRQIRAKKGGWPMLIEMRKAYKSGQLKFANMTKSEANEYLSLMDKEGK